MTQRSDLPMEIASQDILDNELSFGKTLAIDSRTGAVSDYDSSANPTSKSLSELDDISAIMSAFDPQITLAYSPALI